MKTKILFLGSLFLLNLALWITSPPSSARSNEPSIGGCRVFPPDNPWNARVDQLPVHAQSADYVKSVGENAPLHADFGTFYRGVPNGFHYVVVPEKSPTQTIQFEIAGESDPGPYPIPENPPIEARPDGKGDRHLLIVQQGTCKLYEVYDTRLINGVWSGWSGAIFDLNSNKLRTEKWTSADAAGLPILPGTVRLEEVEAGEIRHALRVTVPRTQRAYIHPARHHASKYRDKTYPPMGLRFRLKKNFDISGFSKRNQVILQALKTYGMFVADNGQAWFLSGIHNSEWKDRDLLKLGNIKGKEFEAVETGTIIAD